MNEYKTSPTLVFSWGDYCKKIPDQDELGSYLPTLPHLTVAPVSTRYGRYMFDNMLLISIFIISWQILIIQAHTIA